MSFAKRYLTYPPACSITGCLVLAFIGASLCGCQSEQPAGTSQGEAKTLSDGNDVATKLSTGEALDAPIDKANSVEKDWPYKLLESNHEPIQEANTTPEAPAITSRDSDPQNDSTQPSDDQTEQTIEIPAHWNRLGKNEIWVDMKAKQVIFAGTVCMNNGQLEMFVCPVNTKEHESVIAAHAMSSEVHASLMAIGANPGEPASWEPRYKPATGPIIDVNITWRDEEENKNVTRPARSMIRDVRTKKAMIHQWVFGGSQIFVDPDNGDKIYYGDSGELICLSNFSTATMDLNVESSESNEGLLFETFTENIPPVGTKVYVQLTPGKRIEAKVEKPADAKASDEGKSVADANSGDEN